MPFSQLAARVCTFYTLSVCVSFGPRQCWRFCLYHCSDFIMSAMASQITIVSIVCSTACSCVYQRKHQSSASLAFARGINWSPVDSPHKGPVARNMFSIDDAIMYSWKGNRFGYRMCPANTMGHFSLFKNKSCIHQASMPIEWVSQ